MPEILTVKEAAKYLHIGRAAVRAMARRSALPAVKIAGKWRFSRRQLRRWFEHVIEDQTLERALNEAAADPNNQERMPLEQVREELGL